MAIAQYLLIELSKIDLIINFESQKLARQNKRARVRPPKLGRLIRSRSLFLKFLARLLSACTDTNTSKYLYGQEFKGVKDHQPLQLLRTVTNSGPRLARWIVRQESFVSKSKIFHVLLTILYF
ncbi:hypothetical protein BpHYR1_027022 [Brachionus plicatilis]|uniref:Uncharacterized protein n=1 Tax=Brachionus plicatilis TaxID=10195 RepID=A0A3M7PGZ3_BRAPC|nr:hypothetical protein BpHYR1_027022 [Brachionus plicatilis]